MNPRDPLREGGQGPNRVPGGSDPGFGASRPSSFPAAGPHLLRVLGHTPPPRTQSYYTPCSLHSLEKPRRGSRRSGRDSGAPGVGPQRLQCPGFVVLDPFGPAPVAPPPRFPNAGSQSLDAGLSPAVPAEGTLGLQDSFKDRKRGPRVSRAPGTRHRDPGGGAPPRKAGRGNPPEAVRGKEGRLRWLHGRYPRGG